jgi:hypothetical protein
MRAEEKAQEKRITVGLKRAGLFVQRESQRLVPVDTGNLKASAFTRTIKTASGDVDVLVGYTAAYALYVHEMEPASPQWGRPRSGKKRGAYWDPANRGGPKFLERVVRTRRPEILKIIRASAGKPI